MLLPFLFFFLLSSRFIYQPGGIRLFVVKSGLKEIIQQNDAPQHFVLFPVILCLVSLFIIIFFLIGAEKKYMNMERVFLALHILHRIARPMRREEDEKRRGTTTPLRRRKPGCPVAAMISSGAVPPRNKEDFRLISSASEPAPLGHSAPSPPDSWCVKLHGTPEESSLCV